MSFRYYLYISDSKVDMLLGQIDPAFKDRRTSEFSMSLRLFGARRSTESSVGDERTARLERVVRHLEEHGVLGAVDEPEQFFWGLMPMRWGPFAGDPRSSLIYFGGRSEGTIVGLGGSSGHMLGSASQPDRLLSPSLMPSLLRGLSADPEIAALFDDRAEGADAHEADRNALRAVHLANTLLSGPLQNAEFVAKRLLHGPSPYPEHDPRDGMSVLLGSPLYVALVD